MSTYTDAINTVLAHEGSSIVPSDNNRGPSRWGITLATYRATHPEADEQTIHELTREQAVEFYRDWWERYGFGQILDQELAAKAFDLSVNFGPAAAVRLLQQVAWVKRDGILGPKTAAALNAMEPTVALTGLRLLAEHHYRAIAECQPQLAGCLAGWLRRLAA